MRTRYTATKHLMALAFWLVVVFLITDFSVEETFEVFKPAFIWFIFAWVVFPIVFLAIYILYSWIKSKNRQP